MINSKEKLKRTKTALKKNSFKRIKKRASPRKLEEQTSPLSQEKIDFLAKSLTKQIDKEIFEQKYAPIKDILKLVGAGAFLAASLAFPTLPMAIKPFLKNPEEYEAWKRFNIPYLKRTLQRLEEQKLVEISEEKNVQVVKITNSGRRKILRFAIDELALKKPHSWNGSWTLVTYDIPEKFHWERDIFREYLKAWKFFRIEKSVFLHAYPCQKEIDFLREYLRLGEFINIFLVSKIEKDKPFRDFFGI